ncbi:50S ribosomal protein L4 [Pseudenhygromyxa sp. WMMC2535]|uniref:50S ribosomal protein L4 n=1 Tax=Pseudenhygromyxa sp. WMMC2535 TaxID=2712867 RepID=UPI001554EB6E|nr:50S ribosomal protein L4 [Pseudenhygromyxa sp. WMMC2535]NVB36821.1 50S ribosomal protein L4 [Pseudenhygromyxa sp. WMMC2535]
MAKLNVIDLEGNGVAEIEVSDEVFAAEVKEHLLWEVVRWQRAKRRAGTAKTKERSEVHGTHAKMFKQKGTGRARHGSSRVNVFRGGGQVHGPRPRSYEFSVNKKARAGALRSALSLRAGDGNLVVIRDLDIPEGKTRNLAAALTKLNAPKALLVDDRGNTSLVRSSRNLTSAQHIAPEGLNVYDILRFPKLLMSERSLRSVEARLLGTPAETEGGAQ